MYESFFRLTRRPFQSAPLPDCYFAVPETEHVRHTLIRCAELGQGPALLLGAAGSGKSLMCQLLAKHFQGRFQVVVLGNVRASNCRELLQTILYELALPYRDQSEGELQLALIDFLQSRKTPLILLVDEAHLLSVRLLEELRIISNLIAQGQPQVRLVLSGGLALEEKFAHPKLTTFQQRIAARCYLQPLSREETFEYVRYQLRIAGGSADEIFDDAALQAIYQCTTGIPRLVNQVTDYALLLASLSGNAQIDAAAITEAWNDLQQLPGPWQPSTELTENGQSIIEFGSLDDASAFSSADNPVSRSQQSLDSIQRNMADALENGLDSIDRSDFETIGASASTTATAYQGPMTANTPADEWGPQATVTSASSILDGLSSLPENPFGDDFQEEIIVLDSFASFGPEALRGRPQVSCTEGKQWAAAFARTPDFTRRVLEGELATPVEPVLKTVRFDPANDPVLPEIDEETAVVISEDTVLAGHPAMFQPDVTAETQEEAICWDPEIADLVNSMVTVAAIAEEATWLDGSEAERRAEKSANSTDDRDLLIIHDSPNDALGAPVGRVRRREYRQLFARLRSRSSS